MASRNRGKRKVKLRDLSREWPTWEEAEAFHEAMQRGDQHPIVVAIIGASLVEYQLERMLRPRFRRRDDETWENLTSQEGPLGTFGAKIIAGYAFGLLDIVAQDWLQTVRRIRNQFAHAKKPISFDNELIRKELRDVTMPKRARGRMYRDFKSAAADDPRSCYIFLCLMIENRLLAAQVRAAKAWLRRRKTLDAKSIVFNALARGLSPRQQGSAINSLKSLRAYRPVGPKHSIPGSSSATFPPSGDVSRDKRDK